MNKWLLVALMLSLPTQAASQAALLSAKEIMLKNDEARRVNEFETKAKLESGNAQGGGAANTDVKVKDFTFWRKVQSDGVHNNTLTRFHTPSEVRNEGILIVENASGKNDVLLYLPSFKKIRRVESQQQSGSFMGSVFSYSDIAAPHVSDYDYKTLREEKCPSTEAAQVQCTVIECTPANDDVKERTGYAKSIVWVRQDNFMGTAAEYYDLDGALYKKMAASQIKLVDAKNKKWLAHSLFIQNVKTHDYTKLDFSNVKVNTGILDSIFTQQNLQKEN